MTDRARLGTASVPALLDRLRAALDAGVDAIQIRERDLTDRALAGLVRAAVAMAQPRVPVLVNDRIDIALAAGAAGAHLRADSIAARRLRTIVPDGFIIGQSVHSIAEMEIAADGCDYLMFGTIYSSVGKPPEHPVAGPVALAEACRRSPLPVIAIGGIDASHAREIADAGAAGLAAIGAFMTGDAEELRARVRAMRDAFDSRSRLI